MYNRYIPQADGSFRRSRMPDNLPQQEPPREEHNPDFCPPPEPECEKEPPVQKAQHQRSQRPNACPPPRQASRPPRHEQRGERRDGSVISFLRQLLPKDFDTSDFLVVILLLLMSGDCAEDQNTALLTLALYLFM